MFMVNPVSLLPENIYAMREDEMSLTPKKEGGSPSLLRQTKAKFDAVLRAAVRLSDPSKNPSRSPLKRSSRNDGSRNIFSSQRNLIDNTSEHEVPTLEIFRQKKTKSKNDDVSETSFSSPIRKKDKSTRRSLIFGSPSRKSYSSTRTLKSKRESSATVHAPDDKELSDSNEILTIEQTQESEDDEAEQDGSIPIPFTEDVSQTDQEEEPVIEIPKPLPRKKSLKVNDSVEEHMEKPVPKARSIYGTKQTEEDSRSEITIGDMHSNQEPPKTSESSTKTDDASSVVFKTFSQEELSQNLDEHVKEAIKTRSRGKTVVIHKPRIRKHLDNYGTELAAMRKAKKSGKSTTSEEKWRLPSNENFLSNKIIGVYVHYLTWLGHSFSKSVLIKPFMRVSIYQTNRSHRPLHPPIKTRRYNCYGKRDATPRWEELVVFPVDFQIVEDKFSIIFFEILDMKIGFRRSQDTEYCMAWAFLKPIGVNGIDNTHTKIQLQLYKPRHKGKEGENSSVYDWWSSIRRKKFPGTLYVTVKGLEVDRRESQTFVEEVPKSTTELEKENDMYSTKEVPSWSRIPGQTCKLPNSVLFKLPALPRGCLTVRFSQIGDQLASACSDSYGVQVYQVPSGELRFHLVGHQGLVYDLCWTSDDSKLFSASSDRTVCVWDMTNNGKLLQFLPHPSFVYSCDVTSDCQLAVSACYDRIIRLWTLQSCVLSDTDQDSYELHQELLDGHKGYVTAVCFGIIGKQLYSGDSLGVVNEWARKPGDNQWLWSRQMCPVLGAVVNRLCPHPAGRRLLVHARDSALRILDLQSGAITHTLKGAVNCRIQTSACFSPCGGLVLAGGEDGLLTVWDADSGRRVAVYRPPFLAPPAVSPNRPVPITTVAAVDYHPRGHALAFCAYGFRTAVYLYRHRRDASDTEVGLTRFVECDGSTDWDSNYNRSETSIPKTSSMPDKGDNKSIQRHSAGSTSAFNESNQPPADIVQKESAANEESVKLSNLIKKIDLILSPVRKSRARSPPPVDLINNKFINVLSELKSHRRNTVTYENAVGDSFNEIVVVGEEEQEQLTSLSSQNTYVVNKIICVDRIQQPNSNVTMSEDSLMSKSRANYESSTVLSDEDTTSSRNKAKSSEDCPDLRTYSVQQGQDEDLAQTSSCADSLSTDTPSSQMESPAARRERQISNMKASIRRPK